MSQNVNSVLINNMFVFHKVYGSLYEHFMKKIDPESSKASLRILYMIRKLGPMPISYIGERMSIAKPNMTLIIDGITKKGLVERCASSNDRRVINIALTEEGINYLDMINLKLNKMLMEKVKAFSEEEKTEVIKSIDTLISFSEKVLNV